MINGRKSELLSLAGFCIFHHREVMKHMAENRDKYLQLDEVIQQNKGKQGAVMITLQAAQNIFEHVPRDVQVRIAEGLDVPLSEVYGVATFYSQFAPEPRKGQTLKEARQYGAFPFAHTDLRRHWLHVVRLGPASQAL